MLGGGAGRGGVGEGSDLKQPWDAVTSCHKHGLTSYPGNVLIFFFMPQSHSTRVTFFFSIYLYICSVLSDELVLAGFFFFRLSTPV